MSPVIHSELIENRTGELLKLPATKDVASVFQPKIIRSRNKRVVKVNSIAEKGICLDENCLTSRAVLLFERDEQLKAIVVTRQEKPQGLILRYKLNAKLGTRFGYDVFMRRPVTLIMDADPLILGLDTPVEIASQLAMNRNNDKIYDDMILTDGELYYGVVSVQNLLNIITQCQIELARAANPLTNLPGNPVIQDEITDRLESGEKFAVIYCDLDNFKAYNDYYGFEYGDQLLLLVADILQRAVNKQGATEVFLGHIGGDDFLIIAAPEQAEQLCQDAIAMFDAEIPSLYQEKDRMQGYIYVRDRQGICQHYPLMTISMAIVSNERIDFKSHLEVAEAAAEVKKYVKSRTGSNYDWDRRHSN